MQQLLIGFGVGIAIAIVVLISMSANAHKKALEHKKEINKLKNMLTDRMDIESEGLQKLKDELESLKKENENLRVTVSTYSQKPGRKELSRFHVYQLAVDRLTLNSPGFGAAWQAALKESEDEFQKTYKGIHPFIRKVIPLKTDAQIVNQIDDK